jgi:hypothetical protein
MYRPLHAYMPPHTHRQRYITENKIVPNTDNFMKFAILYFYNFTILCCLYVDTIIQNIDNEI